MTMAVGFLCNDGVVIGADRQVTGANYTFPERKVTSTKWKNGHGIFAYSGERDTYLEFVREMGHRFDLDAILQPQDIRQSLKDCLAAVVKKKESFFVLMGFWIDGGRPTLLLATRDKVVDVPRYEVIGYGDSPLARSLLGRLRAIPQIPTIVQARIYAVDFISQAKTYDGQYVGGPIDVWSVDHSDGGKRCARILDGGQTGAWEHEIGIAHYWLDILFSRLADTNDPVSIADVMDKLKKFRTWVGGHPNDFRF